MLAWHFTKTARLFLLCRGEPFSREDWSAPSCGLSEIIVINCTTVLHRVYHHRLHLFLHPVSSAKAEIQNNRGICWIPALRFAPAARRSRMALSEN